MAAPEGRIDVYHHLLPIFYREAQRARHYFEQLYYDVAPRGHFTPLAALQNLADPSKILFDTDFSYIPDDKTVAKVAGADAYAGFGAESSSLMERKNSLRVLPRLAG